jgi:Tol biopolymer transport system component
MLDQSNTAPLGAADLPIASRASPVGDAGPARGRTAAPGRVAAGLAFGLALAAAPAWAAGVERVDVGPGGVPGDAFSGSPTISPDGRFVAFNSSSTNLAPGGGNGATHVLVHDRQTGETLRASVGPGGVLANGFSDGPTISAGGRLVAFSSDATNLVANDTNGQPDVFVHDTRTRTTRRVSVGQGGAQGNGYSARPALSADGRFVAFESAASNLVPGDTNRSVDVFVRDLETGRTRRASLRSGGGQSGGGAGPAISANGRYVAFISGAADLVRGDTNGQADVFVHDLTAGTTKRASLGRGGVQANSGNVRPSISADGRYVAFESTADNLVPGDTRHREDVYIRDLTAGTTSLVSRTPGGLAGNGLSAYPQISADGRFVVFQSLATNLVPGDTNAQADVFLHERRTGVTRRTSVGPGGVEANGGSGTASVSADGCFVAFASSAANLVTGGTDGRPGVFVRTRCR